VDQLEASTSREDPEEHAKLQAQCDAEAKRATEQEQRAVEQEQRAIAQEQRAVQQEERATKAEQALAEHIAESAAQITDLQAEVDVLRERLTKQVKSTPAPAVKPVAAVATPVTEVEPEAKEEPAPGKAKKGLQRGRPAKSKASTDNDDVRSVHYRAWMSMSLLALPCS
jgi:molecular chaperone GrpE (heat shock protein)